MSSTPHPKSGKRRANVYDAVAGRVGLSGFLKFAEPESNVAQISAPEEVLLRRIGAPDVIPYDYYNADTKLDKELKLPESDVLIAIHAYAADFFRATTLDAGLHDFSSLDETALLALGILLEEAVLETLGETGDMALTEPEGLEIGLPESALTSYQIVGKVRPNESPKRVSRDEYNSEDDDSVEQPRKRRK